MLARRRAATPEDRVQAELVRWARTDPALRLLFHVPNGGERNPIVGGQMVALGARKGVPDLMLPVARGPYHGLFLEIKAEDGSVSDHQRRWLADLEAEGYRAVVAYGLEEARSALLDYVGITRTEAAA